MFFKEKKGDTKTSDLARVAALLIHAAKIDENFSKEEEVIISKALLKIGADQDNLENILKEGKEIEENSNQILDFTREVKNINFNTNFIYILFFYSKIDTTTIFHKIIVTFIIEGHLFSFWVYLMKCFPIISYFRLCKILFFHPKSVVVLVLVYS